MEREIRVGDILEMISREGNPKKIKAFFRRAILPAAKGDYENARQAMVFCLDDYFRPDNIDRKKRIKVWEDALRPYFQKSPDIKAILLKEETRSYLRDLDSFLAGSIKEIGEENLRSISRRIKKLALFAGIALQNANNAKKEIGGKKSTQPAHVAGER